MISPIAQSTTIILNACVFLWGRSKTQVQELGEGPCFFKRHGTLSHASLFCRPMVILDIWAMSISFSSKRPISNQLLPKMNEFHQNLNAILTHLFIMIVLSTLPFLIISFACPLDPGSHISIQIRESISMALCLTIILDFKSTDTLPQSIYFPLP